MCDCVVLSLDAAAAAAWVTFRKNESPDLRMYRSSLKWNIEPRTRFRADTSYRWQPLYLY